jgi:hypothetical protein
MEEIRQGADWALKDPMVNWSAQEKSLSVKEAPRFSQDTMWVWEETIRCLL